MKSYTKLFTILFILGFIMLFFLPNVKGFDDIEFTFEKNTLYNNSEVDNEFFSNFNLKNQTYYDGTYPATYSFTDDDDDSNPTDWTTVELDNNEVYIYPSVIGHDKIVRLDRDDITTNAECYNTFIGQTIGTIEFWIRILNQKEFRISIDDGNLDNGAYIGLRNDLNVEYLSSGWQDTGVNYILQDWHHIKIEFNISTDWHFWFDGISLDDGEGYGWRDSESLGNIIRIWFSTFENGGIFYFDAVGYSFGKPIWINCNEISIVDGTYLYGDIDDDTYYNDSNVLGYHSVIPKNIDLYFFFDNITVMRNLYLYWYIEAENVDNLLFLLISGILIQENLSYLSGNGVFHSGLIYNVRLTASDYYQTFDVYIDLIRFAYNENYTIGSNIIPILKTDTNYLEVDKYEFGLENPNSLYSLGHHDIISNWNSIEIDDGTSEIIANPLNENDRMLEFEVINTNDIGGISIIDIDKSGLFLNVSFKNIKLIAGLAHDAHILFNILSIPSENNVFQLKMDFSDMTLSYNNGSGYTKIDDIELNQYYDFYLFINYELDLCTLNYYREGVLMKTLNSLPLLILSQSGIYSVGVKCISEGDSAVMRIDSVGIYMDSRSLNNNEYAWCTLYLGASWFAEVYNIFKYKSNGSYHLSIVQGFDYSVGSSMNTLKGFSLYEGIENTLNIYEIEVFVVIPLVLFNIKGSFFNVSSLSVEGVILTQDTHIYYLEFEFSGVNSNVSYFYVDSNNRLQFIYEASQYGVLEFIQASFNINDRDSNNTVIQFTSKKDLGAFGFFRIAFDDTSQLIPIETGIRTKRITVSKTETIKEFIILISDTNKDTITGLTTGYITNIKLLDVEQAFASIISLNLIGMIIPLIIIILPTMLISKLYGDFLVIPLFIMFSLILTISNMIPIWLFFIILLSNSLLIFFEKDKKLMF